ncbi:uncharacterized protein DUF2865 [Hoeflea halophila]|uniref:Uncharacterized protein DUF2865 n=1 Tax=Hoeflea halophila TaxID=714899 RepID=A0A286HLJ0_9HYPH|nr:DUF2865 domain-containing protein [Hoeflea halophila]SOE08597.1 uncharacterized protein DUF2865 [Hoeflea halophila]
MRRVSFRSSLAVLALVLAGTGAADASAVCARLQTQLENASAGSGVSAKYQRFARAADEQAEQIDQVEADLTRFHCPSGSFVEVGSQNAKICTKLNAARTKMRANLGALERKRDAYASRADKTAIRRIQAALDANDCSGQRSSVQAAASKGKLAALKAKSRRNSGVVAVLGDGSSTGRSDTLARQTGVRIVVEPRAARGGNYRTLCVRTCDGFFFPVSSAAAPSDFGRDERTCQMMCPGTQTALFFHHALGQESADMISARSRESYTEMPYAFAYRNARAPMSQACGCNMRAFYTEMQRREAILNGTSSGDEAVTTWVRPFNRPDPGEDPESVLNSEAQLTPEDISAVLSASTAERSLTQKHRNVRIVGPAFLPDQSDRLDLKSGTLSLIR